MEKVHFRGTMHCLPQGLKSTFFEIFSNGAAPKGPAELKKIQKMLILAFEVIVQLPKQTFEIGIFFSCLSSLCDGLGST